MIIFSVILYYVTSLLVQLWVVLNLFKLYIFLIKIQYKICVFSPTFFTILCKKIWSIGEYFSLYNWPFFISFLFNFYQIYGFLLKRLHQNCSKTALTISQSLVAVSKEECILCHLLCPDMITPPFSYIPVFKPLLRFSLVCHFKNFLYCSLLIYMGLCGSLLNELCQKFYWKFYVTFLLFNSLNSYFFTQIIVTHFSLFVYIFVQILVVLFLLIRSLC